MKSGSPPPKNGPYELYGKIAGLDLSKVNLWLFVSENMNDFPDSSFIYLFVLFQTNGVYPPITFL